MFPANAIGITTTVPIEILLAAGLRPLDLNNRFITHPERAHFALEAEKEGLPRTVCGWNKGVLVAALISGVRRIVEVVQGDCSTSEAVGHILSRRGVEILPFAYPFDADAAALLQEMETLAARVGTDLAAAEEWWRRLAPTRALLRELDELTWQGNRVSGFENHLYLVSGSDLNGDPEGFHRDLEVFLHRARTRVPFPDGVRLGFLGVPPMVDDLYTRIEELGGRVVFNEIQRQFSMCEPAPSLLEQYRRYTYPYSAFQRVEDVKREAARRGLHGFVHYVQSFCFHQLEDQVFRHKLDLPILTLETDRPGPMDPRDALRLENFLHTLRPRQARLPGIVAPSGGIRIGLDLGSRWVKVAVLEEGEVLYRERFDTIAFYREFFHIRDGHPEVDRERLLARLHEASGLPLPGAAGAIRTTGYGRYLLALEGLQIVPELEAHVRGARAQLQIADFTLLDIGGQDTKVIQVRNGRMADFAMNDRCAAGGGRYLENMARLLGLTLQEMGLYYADPVRLNATCATFGESEVVGRIVEGVPQESICAGVNYTVFQRVLPDLLRLPSQTLVVTGGVAHNRAILHFLRTETPFAGVLVPPDPQFNGAIGVAQDPLPEES